MDPPGGQLPAPTHVSFVPINLASVRLLRDFCQRPSASLGERSVQRCSGLRSGEDRRRGSAGGLGSRRPRWCRWISSHAPDAACKQCQFDILNRGFGDFGSEEMACDRATSNDGSGRRLVRRRSTRTGLDPRGTETGCGGVRRMRKAGRWCRSGNGGARRGGPQTAAPMVHELMSIRASQGWWPT